MRRALVLLCALFCIWSSLFSAAFAVEIPPDLDDLGIDPWGDLGLIQETPEPTPTTALIGEPALQDPVELEPAGEEEASFFSVNPSQSVYYYTFKGVQLSTSSVTYPSSGNTYSVDWPGNPTDFTFPSTPLPFNALLKSGTLKCDQAGTWRYGPVITSSSYFTVGQVTSISAIDTPVIRLSGTVLFYLPYSIYTSDKRYLYPSGVQISVNNMPFGDIVTPNDDHSFTFSDTTIDISSFGSTKIINVGFRFYFQEQSRPFSVSFSGYQSGRTMPWSCYLFYNDASVKWSFLKEIPNGPSADQSAQQHEETKGLLNSIIAFLQSIINGIGNIATAIVELPGKIANLIIEGIKSLFIPSEEDLNGLKDKYQALLSERLGFIWQAGEWIISFGSDLLSALSGGSEAEFVFPGVGFDMNGEHYQLIAEQTVDFDSNGIVTVIRPFVGTIVALVVVAACVNLFHDMVGALISGKSYFDFLKGGGG
jgi:hypothetical protein